MKKVIILATAGILSFVLGTAGIYLAMPSLAPGIVDSTRTSLDSLGLLAPAPNDSVIQRAEDAPVSEMISDTASTPGGEPDSDSLSVPTSPTISMASVESILSDSLRRTTALVVRLTKENAALIVQLEELEQKFDAFSSQQIDTAELGKSLSKLEDKQLGNILAGLDLGIVEQLYLEASGRDQSRLLQNLPADRAARFVKMLVSGPISANEMATQQPIGDKGIEDDVDAGAGGGPGAGAELSN